MGRLKKTLAPAKYRCLKCGYEWEEAPVNNKLPGPTRCPKCGHQYVKWLNYEEEFVR